MKQQDYNNTITVNAKPGKIIESICNVSCWWATNVEGNSEKLGDVFTVRFGKTYSTIKITEFIPLKKICWLVTDSYLPLFKKVTQWNNTKIIWEILSGDTSPVLIMTHVGLTPETECYNDCNKGWNFYVGESLFQLITTGNGLQGYGIFAHISNKDKKYEGMLYSKNDPLPLLTGEYILIDVKQTNGEHVTAMHAAGKLDNKHFNPGHLKGEYYMLLENKPLFNGTNVLKDLYEIMNT